MTPSIPTRHPHPLQPYPINTKLDTQPIKLKAPKAPGVQFSGSNPLETIDPNDLEAIQQLPNDLSLQQIAMRVAPKTSNPQVMKYLAQSFKQRYKNVDHPVNPLLQNTLLHIAVSTGDPILVEVLLKAGANPLAQNKKGENAFQWAETKMKQATSPATRRRIQQMLAGQLKTNVQRSSSNAKKSQKTASSVSSWLSFPSFSPAALSLSWLPRLSIFGNSASSIPVPITATPSGAQTPETPTPEMPKVPQTEAPAAQNPDLSKHLNASKAQNAALKKQLNESKTVIQKLEKQCDAVHTENQQLRTKLSRLTQEKDKALSRLKATLSQITEERDQQQTQLNHLEQQVIALEKASGVESKQQEHLKNRLAQKAEEVTTMNQLLESQRQAYETIIYRLNNEHAAEWIKRHSQPQPAAISSAQLQASHLDITIRLENQKLKKETDRLHHEVKYLNGQLTQANQQLHQSQGQYRAWISRLFNDHQQLQAHLTQTQWERDETAYIMQHKEQTGQQLLTDFQQQEKILSTLHHTLAQQQEKLERQAQDLNQHHETLTQLNSQKTILAKTVKHLMHLSALRQGVATQDNRVTQTVLDDLQSVLGATQSPDAAQATLEQAALFRQRQSENSPLVKKLATLQARPIPENRSESSAKASAQRPKTLLRSRSFS